MREIPRLVASVVGDVLGAYYYNHRRLEVLFMESGAPGDPPEGNCARKTESWLLRCNSAPDVDPFSVLGGVLVQFLEGEPPWDQVDKITESRARVHATLV